MNCGEMDGIDVTELVQMNIVHAGNTEILNLRHDVTATLLKRHLSSTLTRRNVLEALMER